MTDSPGDPRLALAQKLADGVLTPLKNCFIDKDEIVDLLGVALVAGENLFLLGPPGTAKSAVVQELARRIEGRVFDYLLTRFTEPNELFGPFDIRRLREGELLTNTEGMLPEADLVFLDELLNANSAILNSLLMVLNERVFRRGRETRKLPLLTVVGASNRLPEDESLAALFDRFLLRVRCDNVATEQLQNVLVAGWQLELRRELPAPGMTVAEIAELQQLLRHVDLSGVRAPLGELVQRLRHAGVSVSDRRAVKLQRAVGASAVLCGRFQAQLSDLWVLRYIWDTEEQMEVLQTLVQDALAHEGAAKQPGGHPRARSATRPDPESLARDLERISSRLDAADLPAHERSFLRDQLGVLASRCAWVGDSQQREYLESRVAGLVAPDRRPRMKPAWALFLPADQAPAAARLRLEPGIEVLEMADGIWLCGDTSNERMENLLRQMPGAQQYGVLPDCALRPAASRLPRGKLPEGHWTRLKTWAQVELPTAAFAAKATAQTPLRLVRVVDERVANVLLTPLAEWKAYGTTAPQIRLQSLRFALSAEGQAVIHGSPMPPLAGERFCEQASVAVPCGFGWSPAVEHELLRDAWKLQPPDLAVVAADGSWVHVRAEQFVRATRSAIRDSALTD